VLEISITRTVMQFVLDNYKHTKTYDSANLLYGSRGKLELQRRHLTTRGTRGTLLECQRRIFVGKKTPIGQHFGAWFATKCVVTVYKFL
jgi:hypothetical protein